MRGPATLISSIEWLVLSKSQWLRKEGHSGAVLQQPWAPEQEDIMSDRKLSTMWTHTPRSWLISRYPWFQTSKHPYRLRETSVRRSVLTSLLHSLSLQPPRTCPSCLTRRIQSTKKCWKSFQVQSIKLIKRVFRGDCSLSSWRHTI